MKITSNFLFYIFVLVVLNCNESCGQGRYSTAHPAEYTSRPVEQLYQIGIIKDGQMQQQIDAEHQQVMNQISNVKIWYSNQTTFKTPSENDWNIITATDNYSFCGVRKVFVLEGKVVRYIGQDGITELSVLREETISKGKATIQLLDSGDFVDVYF